MRTDGLTSVGVKLLVATSLTALGAAGLLLQSPPSMAVTRGSKVNLTCDISQMGGRCSLVVWLHVGRAGALRQSGGYAPARGGTRCGFELASAAPQDAGRYYCVYINGLMLLMGGGTTLTVAESPALHPPALDLLVPSDGHAGSSGPVPVICRASGLEDPSRVRVDWEADSADDLRPRTLPDGEAGVISVQAHVPAEAWQSGSRVSCTVTDGELTMRRTAGAAAGMPKQCILPTSLVGAACAALFIVAVALGIRLSCQQRRPRLRPAGPSRAPQEAADELHYAALRFDASDRRNV